MNLAEWKKIPGFVLWMKKFTDDQNFVRFLEVLDAEHPRRRNRNDIGSDRILGTIEGWDSLSDLIKEMGKEEQEEKPIEATYGAEDLKENENA